MKGICFPVPAADKSLQELTVVITNCRRPDKLWQAFRSAFSVGVENIIISSSLADQSVFRVYDNIRIAQPKTIFSYREDDEGCNETWLRGVRLAKTKWVHILHDDDLILPAYSCVGSILKADGVQFLHCDGAKHGSGSSGVYQTFGKLRTGVHSTDRLWEFLLATSHTLSPVSGIFPTEHVLSVLEECERHLTAPEFYYRPKMMVGNDLLIWLRAAENYPKFYYSKIPWISYGHWTGSVSFEDAGNRNKKLPSIYNSAQQYYLKGPGYSQEKSKALVHIKTAFGKGTPAVSFAEKVWEHEYQLAPWSLRVVEDSAMPRLFDDGKRKVPYVKDMIRSGIEGVSDDSICVFTNSDIIPAEGISAQLLLAFETHDCAFSYRRDIMRLRTMSPAELRLHSNVYGGLDLFAFTKRWWIEHENEYPDMLFATEAWDYCMRILIEKYRGRAFYYLIYHLAHVAETLRNHNSLSQRHNKATAEPFVRANGIEPYWFHPGNSNPR